MISDNLLQRLRYIWLKLTMTSPAPQKTLAVNLYKGHKVTQSRVRKTKLKINLNMQLLPLLNNPDPET